MPASLSPRVAEIPSTTDHAETARDPLRNIISPLVTNVISNTINVIALLEAFSGMIPAPPETVFTLVKAIGVQKARLDISRGLRLVKQVEQFGRDVCAAVGSDSENVDWPMAIKIARLLKSLVEVYKILEKHLTKNFVYRFVHYRKVSRVIKGGQSNDSGSPKSPKIAKRS
ncbi:hypothetical protein FOMPIDRAFT_1050526 [Fomitopsis schrenkii]|uniref:Uncharacterized protein n=1 Tax=Fomitopsis schrenkii TaxID=2126942 RepID=S8E807_FOMSC|nr:hypothetical protein FOMPIDRAFT_1050526 [Fomitopsis schrenkii]